MFGEKGRIVSIEQRLAANAEWASGKIRSRGIGLVIALWLLVIVWTLTVGVAFIKSFSIPEIKTAAIVMLGLFSAGGIGFAVFAIRVTIRQFRFGTSVCLIRGKAGVLGQEMAGVVKTSVKLDPTGDYSIQLQCLETYTVGSGKNQRTESTLHWEGKQVVSHAGKNSLNGIPFSFAIPGYSPETGNQLARGRVNWQLRIDAPVKGVDYSAIFIVPVFKMN